MILKCTCRHNYQDQKHGPGMRVHNETASVPKTYRCTVCESVRSKGGEQKAKK